VGRLERAARKMDGVDAIGAEGLLGGVLKFTSIPFLLMFLFLSAYEFMDASVFGLLPGDKKLELPMIVA